MFAIIATETTPMAQQPTPTISPQWEPPAQLDRHDPPLGYWVRAGFGIGIGLVLGYLTLALITLVVLNLLRGGLPALF